jgi:hypothetical protein
LNVGNSCNLIILLLSYQITNGLYGAEANKHRRSKAREAYINASYVFDYGEALSKSGTFSIDLEVGETFTGIDGRAERYLMFKDLKPVAQFSCAGSSTWSNQYEDLLERALKKGTFNQKLQALPILLRAEAPASVSLQWKTLNELQRRAKGKKIVCVGD